MRGEAGRLWMYWVPVVVVLAARELAPLINRRPGLAYLLVVLTAAWWFKSTAIKNNRLFSRLRMSVLILVLLQVVLGILTVLNATYTNRLVILGVSHQLIGILLLMVIVTLVFIVRKKQLSAAS